MADPIQRPKGVQPFTPTHLPFVNDTDERLNADFQIAFGCLGNYDQAHHAVLRTWKQLDTTIAAQTDNRRSRYVANAPRSSYRPFIEEDLTRRRLLLGSIRAIQKNNEIVEGKVDDTRNIPWLSLEIGLEVLHHTLFNAVVGMGRVLANYSGKQTLQLYDHVIHEMPEQACKTPPEICRIEDDFAEALIDRFGKRIKCLPRSNKRFQRVKPTPQQFEELRYWLPYFLPNVSDLTKGVVVPIKSEGMEQMKLVNDLLNVDRFNEIANKEELPPFEERVSIPLITSSNGTDTDPETDPDPGGAAPKRGRRFNAPACDVKGIKRALQDAQHKRMSIRPTLLAIYVDDVLCGELQSADDRCALDIKRSARLLVIAARDSEGEEVPLATHVLVHNRAKAEIWEVAAAGMGKVQCALHFKEDGTIHAAFDFIEKVDAVLATLIENNVMSCTMHTYALKILGRIACMPHIVPSIFSDPAYRNEPLMHLVSQQALLLGKAVPHLSWEFTDHTGGFEAIGKLPRQLECSIVLGEPEAVENVQALTEAQMLLRWLWAEADEAFSCDEDAEISREHATRFIKGLRVALNQMYGVAASSVPQSGNQKAGLDRLKTPSTDTSLIGKRGNSIRQKDAEHRHHKVKPSHA